MKTIAFAALFLAVTAHAQPDMRGTATVPVFEPSPPMRAAPEPPRTSFLLDKDFLMYGDAAIAPVAVYATGRKVYIQLEDWRSPPPSVLAVTPTGYVPIRVQVDPPYLVFEGRENEFVLVKGQRYVIVRHASARPILPTEERAALFEQSANTRAMSTDAALGLARDRHASLIAGEARVAAATQNITTQQAALLQQKASLDELAQAQAQRVTEQTKEQDTKITQIQLAVASLKAELDKAAQPQADKINQLSANVKALEQRTASQGNALAASRAQDSSIAQQQLAKVDQLTQSNAQQIASLSSQAKALQIQLAEIRALALQGGQTNQGSSQRLNDLAANVNAIEQRLSTLPRVDVSAAPTLQQLESTNIALRNQASRLQTIQDSLSQLQTRAATKPPEPPTPPVPQAVMTPAPQPQAFASPPTTAPAPLPAPEVAKPVAPQYAILASDKLLSNALQRWANLNGLVFENALQLDFPVLTDAAYSGSFQQAMASLLDEVRSAGVNAEFFENTSSTPPKLVLRKKQTQ